MNNEDRLHHLAGQAHALETMIKAIILTHPDPDALQKVAAILTEEASAQTLPTPVREQYLQGMLETEEQLREAVRLAVARAP